jgi:hypothetical protein
MRSALPTTDPSSQPLAIATDEPAAAELLQTLWH